MNNITYLVKVRTLSEGTIVPDINEHCGFYRDNGKIRKCYDPKTDIYCSHIVENAFIKDLKGEKNKSILRCDYCDN